MDVSKLVFLIFLADFVWDLINVWKGDKHKRYLTKSLLMPLLLVFYITCAENPNNYVIAALVSGFFGGVFLLVDEKKYCFNMGVISFLTGHIFYAIAFIKALGENPQVSPWYVLLILPYVIYGICAYKIIGKIGKNIGNLKPAIITYIFVILFTSITCLFVLVSGKHELFLSYLGTIAFIVSDSTLGYSMFVHKNKYSGILVMLTYVAAKMLIVSGFLRI